MNTAARLLKSKESIIVAAVVLLSALGATTAGAQQILFAQIGSAPPMNSNQFVDIPGLSFLLPAASAGHTQALIILDIPQPYATGNNFPGAKFGINVGGTVVADGGFTYSMQVPASSGRMPTTVVVRVPLANTPRLVRAQWISYRNSTGRIDSFASLSAILGN
ncbi:MAG TPA: hypothetical protein VF713_17555 [Thermoanaerobaculia bacterium]